MLERDVADGVHRVEHAHTNFYVVQDGAGVTVVDAGFPNSWALLEDALRALGRSLADVVALVLTHAHADHLGFAERARRELRVPVFLHERDVTLSRHPLRYEHERSAARYAHPRLLGPLVAMARAGALATKPLADARAFGDEPALDVPGGLVPVRTPGHTHGHTSFHLPGRGVVIAGDALVTHNPYTGGRTPQIMAAASNVDSLEALASLARIADTGAAVVLPGHGPPWTAGAAEAVRLARAAGPS